MPILSKKIKFHMVANHLTEDMAWLGLILDLSTEVVFLLSFFLYKNFK